MTETLHIKDDESDIRLDIFVAERLPHLSRAHVQRLIATMAVLVNGKPGKAGYRTRFGDEISVAIPTARPLEDVQPERIPLDIVYEDADVLVVNKQKGLVVHPAPGAESGTLVNALLAHPSITLSTLGGRSVPALFIVSTKTRPACWLSPKTTSPMSGWQNRSTTALQSASITPFSGDGCRSSTP